ncbi:MAG: GNAT family N-acetyltransferase [Candidatus Omnitrophota bacterium]
MDLSMNYRWIENIEEFKTISAKWDEALIASGSYNPFLLSDFIISWWRHFCGGLRLQFFIGYGDSGSIVAGMPLYLKKWTIGSFGIRILNYVGGPFANYKEPFFSEDANAVSLFKEALISNKDWDALCLSDVRAGNILISRYEELAADKRFLSLIAQDHMNFEIDLSGGKDKYLSTIPKKLKKDLKQKRKHAVRDYGELRLVKAAGKEEVGRYFDIHSDFSNTAFNERNRKNSFETDNCRDFLKEFLSAMDEKGRLDAYALFAGDNILAVIFGYRFGEGFNWAFTSFDYERRYVRPGYLLIEELIDEILRRKDAFCNCYGYESFYKNQWCNKLTPLYRFCLMRHSLRGYFYEVFQEATGILRSNKNITALSKKIKRR